MLLCAVLLFRWIVQNLNINQYLSIFQVGKLSTGDSLDMTQQDESSIIANDATVKDMEVTWLFGLISRTY